MYPGDPSAHPANVYNCRCTLGSKIIGFKKQNGSGEVLIPEEESGIIEESRGISSRHMANGGRKSSLHTLTHSEIESLREDIRTIGADESVFVFNSGGITSYDDDFDVIFVRGDVLPDPESTHPRDKMSSRAVLAHEYYGHRSHRGT